MAGNDALGLYNWIEISIFEKLHIPYVVLLRTFLKPRTNRAHRRLDAEHPALLLEVVAQLEILLVAIYTIIKR